MHAPLKDTNTQQLSSLLKSFPISLCVCDLAISSANVIGEIMAEAGIKAESPIYHSTATRNFSRTTIVGFPDVHVRTVKQSSWSKKAAIRQAALDHIQDLLGEQSLEESDVTIRRLLDSPNVCKHLIDIAVIRQLIVFEDLLKKSPYRFRKQRTEHTTNKARHHQRATLWSYISRAFAPDELPAVTLREGQRWDIEARRELIESLPIEPAKVSDEIIMKLWLAPADYKTHTLQARLRYKLAIRARLLELFARAEVVDRVQADKETARICTLHDAQWNPCIAIFRTVTDLHTQSTEWGKSRRRYHEVSQVACSIFRNPEEALRSQVHAANKLNEKADAYAHLHQSFRDYDDIKGFIEHDGIKEEDLRKFLIADALEICRNREGFYDKKLCLLLIKLFNKPHNALILGHIVDTLYAALRDTLAKKKEIEGVCELLNRTNGLQSNQE